MALRHIATRPVRWMLNAVGHDVITLQDLHAIRHGQPHDFQPDELEIVHRVSPYTMVPPVRIVTLVRAVKHIIKWNVPGGILECGTWKGGCMMAVALTLKSLGVTDRDLYLSDLFGGGWPMPTEHDIHNGRSALKERLDGAPNPPEMIYSLEEVQANLASVGYPAERIHWIPGDVMQTMPAQAPEQIALLRLDTDFYESTFYEMRVLYPRLVMGGFLVVDDYGDWEGSRRAVDQYLEEERLALHLFRVDPGAVMTVKS